MVFRILTSHAVTLPLPRIGLMLTSVVLDHDRVLLDEQVDASHEPPRGVEDVHVRARTRETSEHDHQPQRGLPWRLGPVLGKHERSSGASHAVEVPTPAVPEELLPGQRTDVDEVVDQLHELDHAELPSAVDDRARCRRGRHAVPPNPCDLVEVPVKTHRKPGPYVRPRGEVQLAVADGIEAPQPGRGDTADDGVRGQLEQGAADPDEQVDVKPRPDVDVREQPSEPSRLQRLPRHSGPCSLGGRERSVPQLLRHVLHA